MSCQTSVDSFLEKITSGTKEETKLDIENEKKIISDVDWPIWMYLLKIWEYTFHFEQPQPNSILRYSLDRFYCFVNKYPLI